MAEIKTSKAQQKAVHKYVKKNYDRLDLTAPKGSKDHIKAAAAEKGESVNGYIIGAINSRLLSENRLDLNHLPPPIPDEEQTTPPRPAGLFALPKWVAELPASRLNIGAHIREEVTRAGCETVRDVWELLRENRERFCNADKDEINRAIFDLLNTDKK